KLTVCGEVTGTPLLSTVTLTLVVPNAERGLVPKTGVLRVTLGGVTEKPSEPVVDGTWVVAVRVAAPAAFKLAGFSPTVAVPVASVSAVPEGGASAAKFVLSTVNVTTTLGIATPAASLTIALAVAGAAVVAAPVVGLARVRTSVGTPATGGGGTGGGGVPPPPPPPVLSTPGPPDELVSLPPQLASASATAKRRPAISDEPCLFMTASCQSTAYKE